MPVLEVHVFSMLAQWGRRHMGSVVFDRVLTTCCHSTSSSATMVGAAPLQGLVLKPSSELIVPHWRSTLGCAKLWVIFCFCCFLALGYQGKQASILFSPNFLPRLRPCSSTTKTNIRPPPLVHRCPVPTPSLPFFPLSLSLTMSFT